MNIDLRLGNCIDVMATLPENSVDTIITDPPYGLTFMGKDWDRGVPGVAFWEQALRVAKPGAMLLAMGGTRTFHRLVSAIEDAGWEIRDSMAWLYGSGFPKSYDISKGIDKQAGAQMEVVGMKSVGVKNGAAGGSHEYGLTATEVNITAPSTPAAQLWHGWGTALKPAMELICVAMKPIDGTFVNNALTWGVAGLNIDGGRVQTDEELGRNNHANPYGSERTWSVSSTPPQSNVGSAASGRFPANVIHDGSEEVISLFPQTGKVVGRVSKNSKSDFAGDGGWKGGGIGQRTYDGDGSAARFFYCAKASQSERNAGLEGAEARRKAGAEFRPNHTEKALNGEDGNPYGRWGMTQNNHPTVKPVALMSYLARLTKTPTGGTVLDPFMGSGTTGVACVKEGRSFIGIELDEGYLEIAKKRIEHAQTECAQLSINDLTEE